MVTRKSRAEIERMRRAGRVVAEVLALIEGELKPGVSTAELDRLAEAHIRKSGRDAVVQGLSRPEPAPPVPRQRLHLDRRRDRPRHPGRADHPHRADRVGRRRGDRRWLAWRRRADVLHRRAAGRGGRPDRHDPARAPGRHRRGRARPPHRGHRGRGRGRRHAAGLRHRPPVRRPRHRDRDARGAPGAQLPDRPARAASSSRACAWPSSRCSRSAGPRHGSSTTTGRS